MIFTLTLNPSLDYFIYIENFKINSLNLSKQCSISSGGKGINVSCVLKNLEVNSTAVGFVGGFCGQKIITDLKNLGITNHMIEIAENTRINVKIKETSTETEIAGQSPIIPKEKLKDLINYLTTTLKAGDTIICSGSIPNNVSPCIYKEIAKAIPNVNVILDTRGESLKENLFNNFLIKPNLKELEDMLNQKFTSYKEIVKGCEYFLNNGIKNIIVSMGGEGSLYINQNDVFQALPMNLKVINSVGAGDSMVAGFVAAISKGYNLEDSYKLAVSAASATVSSERLATSVLVEELYSKVIVKRL